MNTPDKIVCADAWRHPLDLVLHGRGDGVVWVYRGEQCAEVERDSDVIAPAPVPGSLSWGAVLYPGEGGDAITIRTQAAGTCTAVVYNGEGSIKQIA